MVLTTRGSVCYAVLFLVCVGSRRRRPASRRYRWLVFEVIPLDAAVEDTAGHTGVAVAFEALAEEVLFVWTVAPASHYRLSLQTPKRYILYAVADYSEEPAVRQSCELGAR